MQSGFDLISHSADLEEHKEGPESTEETNLPESLGVCVRVGEAWMMVPLPAGVHHLE